MIINFYNVEDQPVYYTVLAEDCDFFQQADINTAIGTLPVGTIYEIIDFLDVTTDEMYWAKIKMTDGECFVVITPDKCTIEEIPTIKEPTN